MTKNHFNPSVIPPDGQTSPAYWFVFQGSQLLVFDQDEQVTLPYLTHISELGFELVRQHYMGYIEAAEPIHCYAVEVDEEAEAADGLNFYGLRRLYGRIDDDTLWLAGRAVQIIDWDRTHLYCGRCGAPNEILAHERAKRCPECGLITYPRISPAIIVRVDKMDEDEPKLLLARNHRFRAGWYSVIAGFVEPGETLEECVRREVKEEVGIEIRNVRYFGSQPWPFPNSLMIAYTAEYADGEFVLEEEEIEDARWFTVDTLPKIPGRMSISRRLIDDFVARYGS
jgi:NAD+ diphosphatase